MTPFGVELKDLTVRFPGVTAVDGVTAAIEPGAITGLIGRNGSGKSSLLAAVAAFRRPSAGTVRIAGADPYENARVTAGICLIREGGDFAQLSVREVLDLAATVRETWSAELASQLLDTFELPLKRGVDKLSRGQRSALGAVVGLASRAPLTLFDEIYLGMDAPSRYAFYDALLADYTEHPRTIVISSHLIEEVERLFEHVLVLHHGRLLLQGSAEELRSRAVVVIGPADNVESFVAPYTVLKRQHLGRTLAATVDGEMGAEARHAAAAAGLELQGVSIQDLFVQLTEKGATAPNRAPAALNGASL